MIKTGLKALIVASVLWLMMLSTAFAGPASPAPTQLIYPISWDTFITWFINGYTWVIM